MIWTVMTWLKERQKMLTDEEARQLLNMGQATATQAPVLAPEVALRTRVKDEVARCAQLLTCIF